MANFQLRDIPPDLWIRFKVMSVKRGKTLKRLLLELIKKETERYEREEGEK